MKKIVIIIIAVLFISGCDANINLNSNVLISMIEYVSVSSDSITFKVNTTEKDLRYKLVDQEKVIIDEKIQEINKIEGLDYDKEYQLTLYNSSKEMTTKVKTADITVLRFAGDVTMSLFFENKIATSGVDYPWQDVQAILTTADVSMVNLETSVSERGESVKSEGFGFRSPAYSLGGFINSGVDVVSIANNHIIDYGYDAFYDTMDNLDNYKIKYVGAGRNIEDAMEVKYITTNGIKIGFMGSTSILGKSNWGASEDKSGVLAFQEKNYEKIMNAIKDAKKNCDYLVFSVHWGLEYTNNPTKEQIRLAHQLVDNGVDVVLGHHPHVLQGVEYYKDAIIYYSVGNFIFFIKNENAQHSGIFELVLDNNKIISSKIYPTLINNLKSNLLNKDSNYYKTVIQSMNERSAGFHTAVDMEGNIYKK